ncbi:MAG TPA: amidohydrolase family protein [Acidimicrobiales bacterium]|nr:amidohydrolase family protein [Acidimicrobiales bacterium]
MSKTVTNERLGYGLVDADSHYYEPLDCFTRHIEKGYADRVVHHEIGDDGLARTFIGDTPFAWRNVAVASAVSPPGATKNVVGLDPEHRGEISDIPVVSPMDYPAWMHRDARLELMDEQGVQANVMLPTEAVLVEYELYKMGVDAAFANIRSFNRWIEDDWGYNYQDRLFGVPILSLADLDLAVAELDRVLALGARFVHLNVGPAYGRSPADPHFDPFWGRLAEAGVPAIYHISNSGYNEMVCVHWGLPAFPTLYDESPFQQFLGRGTRPIADTMASLVLGDLFGRFPDLKVMSVENGSAWVGPLLDEMDHATKLSRVAWSSREGKPSEIFKQNVYVAPFWEDSGTALAGIIGVDHVLMGSDFPHAEGEDDPVNFANSLEGLGADDVRKVMRENTANLIGLSL